jgi:hypothetical protein
MNLNYVFVLTLVLAGMSNCTSKMKPKDTRFNKFSKQSCIYDLCFNNSPILIDSILDQSDYNGVILKVYNISINKEESFSFDSLLKKGYKKLPFERNDMSVIPENLKNYIEMKDSGYYYMDRKRNRGSFGDKFLIVNTVKMKLILYDYGILEDLRKEDSLKGIGIFHRQ